MQCLFWEKGEEMNGKKQCGCSTLEAPPLKVKIKNMCIKKEYD